jgi:hypothetical protein
VCKAKIDYFLRSATAVGADATSGILPLKKLVIKLGTYRDLFAQNVRTSR